MIEVVKDVNNVEIVLTIIGDSMIEACYFENIYKIKFKGVYVETYEDFYGKKEMEHTFTCFYHNKDSDKDMLLLVENTRLFVVGSLENWSYENFEGEYVNETVINIKKYQILNIPTELDTSRLLQ